MAGKKRDKIREQDVSGLKCFDKLAPLLERLAHQTCCETRTQGPVSRLMH